MFLLKILFLDCLVRRGRDGIVNLSNYYALLLLPFLVWVIALYFLKSRPGQRRLPSTLLWQQVLLKVNENALWQKFRGSFFLLLQILALVSGLIALLSPVGKGGIGGNILIVFDTSFSMKATDIVPTRFDRAQSDVKTLLKKVADNAQVSIVTVSDSIKMVIDSEKDLKVVESVVGKLNVTLRRGPDHLSLATYLSSIVKNDTTVFLVGDSFRREFYEKKLEKCNVQLMGYGDSTHNSAITNLSVSGSIDECVVSVDVRNFSLQPLEGVLSLKGEHGYLQTQKIKLSSIKIPETSEALLIFEKFKVEKMQQIFSVTFIRNDGSHDLLEDDDQALFEITEGKSTVVCIGGDKSIKRILNLQSGVATLYKSPLEFVDWQKSGVNADLYISSDYYDDFLADKPLILFHPLSESIFTTGTILTDVKPYTGSSTHPVMHYLSFPGLKIQKTAFLKDGKYSTPLLFSEEGILMTAMDNGKLRQVISAFSLANSSFDSDVAFPVFVVNSLKWILGDGLKMSRVYRTGDKIALPENVIKLLQGGKEEIKVVSSDFTTIDDKTKSSLVAKAIDFDSPKGTAMDFFNQSGIYCLTLREVKTAASQEPQTTYTMRYPVSVLDCGESDLRRTQLSSGTSPLSTSDGYKDDRSHWNGKRYFHWFAGAFLFFLLSEWFLFSRKGG
jgi:hypothetical protein